MIFEDQKNSCTNNPNKNIFRINSDKKSEEKADSTTSDYILFPNYPDPFDHSTIINYQIPLLSKVKILILDVLGKEIINLLNERIVPKGIHQVTWNASEYRNGTYLLFMKASSEVSKEEFKTVQKMILNKKH